MLKLLGAVFIIISSTLAGFYISRSYSDRTKQLRILQLGLQMLETEIVYGSVPLYLAMEKIGRRLKGIIGEIFLSMSKNLNELDGLSAFECWLEAIEMHYRKTSLKKQDKEILIHFGQTLGISDKEDQMKHIKLALQNLKTEENLAREEQKSYEKLSKSLGILVGLLIVILMY